MCHACQYLFCLAATVCLLLKFLKQPESCCIYSFGNNKQKPNTQKSYQSKNLPTERIILTSRRLPFQFSVSFSHSSIQTIDSLIYIIQQKQSHQSVFKVRFILGAGIKSQSCVLKFMEDFYNLPVLILSYCLSSKNTHLLVKSDWIQIKEFPKNIKITWYLILFHIENRCLPSIQTNLLC